VSAKERMRGSRPPLMKRRAGQSDDINQTFCLIATGGHLWMRGYYDDLPATVRRRLRESPFNICPACMQLYVLPEVRDRHPNWPHEKLLFAAIEVMEGQVRNPLTASKIRRSK
jgi:hypothetical protein